MPKSEGTSVKIAVDGLQELIGVLQEAKRAAKALRDVLEEIAELQEKTSNAEE